MTCSSCAKEVPLESRFCPSCGSALAFDASPTVSKADAPVSPSPGGGPGRVPPSVSLGDARFVPGTLLAGRYRIVAIAGKGGMGEVYRAEDLKLGQTVALKFLPHTLGQDGAALARFHREVRVARQVSHPNVCRVFDMGETDGLPFLTMEYVDGEDLASLLRRIGRLPQEKGLQISRQLCAGLAAAHDEGVLHRDLKPSNVMIDARGKVRLTDFGLAGLADEFRTGGDRAGTPAYMAPEQMAGTETTIKSDLYSLGLVLYEIFTGKRAFEAAALSELLRLRERNTPVPPSQLVTDLDPLIERVILRCLERDPHKRPVSALQVAAALPGGDPLAAALAAGETPSPEMVAASGGVEGLRPAVAWACLAAVVVGVLVLVVLNAQTRLFGRVPLEKSPEVLAERAREILNHAGYTDPPADSAFGFDFGDEYLRHIREHDKSKTRWDNLETGAITFWYRQSPRVLEPQRPLHRFTPGAIGSAVSLEDPAPDLSGMATVRLNPRGRLTGLLAVPPQVEEPAGVASPPDWKLLFSEAGLDPSKWTATEPRWTPRTYCDTRAAWQGSLPDRPNVPLRVEAAAYRGKPVYFELIGPWTTPGRMRPYQASAGERAAQVILNALGVAMMVGGALLARRNLRLGRGDRQGASRLAFFVLGMATVGWILGERHVPTSYELELFAMSASFSLFGAGFFWVVYIALEPYVRRRWPNTLVSWSRLLAGGLRDPLVGRDILVGCVAGTARNLLLLSQGLLLPWLGSAPPTPGFFNPRLLLGARVLTTESLGNVVSSIFLGLLWLFFLLLLRILLRKQWAAVIGLLLIFALPNLVQGEAPLLAAPLIILIFGIYVSVLVRFGLVALIATFLFGNFLSSFPITTQTSAWYAGIGFSGLFLLAAMTLYGFYVSLAGRPMFGAAALDE